uniref:Secreted protein n=1 Tax=Macrostomum lignano TaxID=282301 RepID=A0A1I8FJT1_9PLAT
PRYPCLGRLVAVATPAARNGGSGDDWIFGDLGSAFPDVFKAVFVLVALVIAADLVSADFVSATPAAWTASTGPPGEGHRRRPNRDRSRRRDEEASGAECSTVLDIDAYTASGELTPAVSSSRGSYPDPFTSSHPLSVVYEPVDEAAEAELDSDEAVAGIKSDAEPSTVPKYSQPVSFVESALVVASRDSAGAEAAGS